MYPDDTNYGTPEDHCCMFCYWEAQGIEYPTDEQIKGWLDDAKE